MAEGDGITGLSLKDVRKLIEDKSLPEDILEVFDKLSGVLIALSPFVTGGVFPGVLWPLLEQKDALVDAAKAAIKAINRSRPADYLAQARRFAAANTLLTFTSYFDALRISEPELTAALGLSADERRRIASEAAAQAAKRAAGVRPLRRPGAGHDAGLHGPASGDSA